MLGPTRSTDCISCCWSFLNNPSVKLTGRSEPGGGQRWPPMGNAISEPLWNWKMFNFGFGTPTISARRTSNGIKKSRKQMLSRIRKTRQPMIKPEERQCTGQSRRHEWKKKDEPPMGNLKTAVFEKQKTLQIEAEIVKIATLNGNHVQSLFKSFFVQFSSQNFDPKTIRI